MNQNSRGHIATVSSTVFATTMVAVGVLGFVKADFPTIWHPLPKRWPALVYLCAAVSLATGLGLLWRRTATAAARALLVYFFLWVLLLRVPGMLLSPTIEFWWAACKAAAMMAAAWVLYVALAADWDKQHIGVATGDSGMRIARALYGLALIPFGLAHFLYLNHTAELVPAWLPWPVAWADFTGCAFIAAGLAILIGVYARLAATLAALQIGIFLLLVWIPIVAAGSKDTFQWSETVVSWALMAGAWVVADSYRGMRWLAVNER